MFETFAKFVAALLIVLVTCPVTAPFSSCDLGTDPSAVQDLLGSESKTGDDAAILAPGTPMIDTAAFEVCHRLVVPAPQPLRTCFSTVLRL